MVSQKIAILLSLFGWSMGHAAGDPKLGRQKAQACFVCHQANGISTNPTYPIIAGQKADYLVHTLLEYKAGSRKNAVMQLQMVNLSEDDIDDLAAYFAQKPGPLFIKHD